MTQPTRYFVRYAGRVQGVGFRYMTARIAQRHAVTGYVRNLSDGHVELVAEGDRDEVARFVDDVSATMGAYVLDTQQEIAPATGEFAEFQIRH